MLAVRGKTVILIDDGIATDSTVRAAVCAFERPTSRGSSSPCRSPPAPPTELRPEVDELVALGSQAVVSFAHRQINWVGVAVEGRVGGGYKA